MKKTLITALFIALFLSVSWSQQGFVHDSSKEYDRPSEKNIREKLDRWQDLKFGVLFHWGLYSVPGIVESWSICSEDVDWISRDSTVAYDDYKRQYRQLIDQFNPTRFDPEQWARVTKDGGMKYMIFTTKHHDGFNLFDTKQTDFSILHGAFKDHPRADVTRYILDAFREQDFMVGTYFSKPDWHCEYYWWPMFATPDRNVNYKIERHPWRWKKFQEFTYNQIHELMTNYGDIDILWLDGGWVRAPKQDIKMDEIAKMARQTQPNLLIVDRTVHGKNENYLTPERSVPEQQLPIPWESCIPLSSDWGWTPQAKFKPADEVIKLLIEVVAKGGNLLLGVGPTPEGIIQPEVVARLKEIGEWLDVNGKAVYRTRITPVYKSGNVWFTADKDGETLYAFYVPSETGKANSSYIEWEENIPRKGSSMVCLKTGQKVRWKQENNTVRVYLPKGVSKKNEILVFSFKKQS
ncbi:MAG TPA: alpha-L-fucosidase [Dysgonamonadaceae bacterium]|nr:alpha-L-fucosidase [Dysgonamonadaceae bacterium]